MTLWRRSANGIYYKKLVHRVYILDGVYYIKVDSTQNERYSWYMIEYVKSPISIRENNKRGVGGFHC